jgi:hypothetical protein
MGSDKSRLNMLIHSTQYAIYTILTIDPSAALRMPVRAGPNGEDRVLGDKGRRVMEIFLEYGRFFALPVVE